MLGHLWEWGKINHGTAFLAAWGAVLSSASFVWVVYREWRDKTRVRVSLRLRAGEKRDGRGVELSSANRQRAGHPLFLVVSVLNEGRYPMKWKGFGGTYETPVEGRTTFVVTSKNLPKVLEEGDEFEENTRLNLELLKGNLMGIHVWDGAGRMWRAPHREIRQLKEDIERYVKGPRKEDRWPFEVIRSARQGREPLAAEEMEVWPQPEMRLVQGGRSEVDS